MNDASCAPDTQPASTAPTADVVHARLLGRPQLALAGRSHALERKDAALLALLALEGPIARERLASLLWPEATGAGARSSLRQRLHRLRRQTGRDLVQGVEQLRLADTLTHDLHTAHARLESDPAAVDGELLATCDYAECRALADWVDAARERWRRERREALVGLAVEHERRGHLAAALACVDRLLRDEPALEAAHRMRMRLHLRRGDRAAALAAYERCRAALDNEMGARVAPDAQTRELHLQALRGVADDAAHAVAAARQPALVAVLRPPRLVGRGREWAELGTAWAAHQVVVLAGEPGVGKTRLLADFAAAGPGRIVVGSRSGDAHSAYALLARLLRELLPRAALPLPPWVEAQLALLLPERGGEPARSWNPLRLRQALHEVISRTAGDVQGVLVDDAQFSDLATLELLTSVCLDRGAGAPNWLIAVRANEVPVTLAAWISAAKGDRLHDLRLGPLDLPGVRALLASLALPGVEVGISAPALLEHTGGNPMFMLETLRALPAAGALGPHTVTHGGLPAPPQVGELIARRLAQLPPAALALAQVAALAGIDFDAALAAAVLERHALDLADPWRELEAAQVIRNAAYAHDLVFEAAQRSVPESRAVELHARIASWLERHAGEPARVALHWHGARQWLPAAHAFAAAAARLRSRVRRDEEAALLEQADACFERAGEHAAHAAARSEALLFLYRSHWDRKDRAGIRALPARLQAAARTPVARLWAALAQAQLATDERPDDASLSLVVAVREATERWLRDADTAALAADAAAPAGTSANELLIYVLTWEATVLAILNQPAAALAATHRVAGRLEAMPRDRWRGHNHYNFGFTFEVCGELGAALAQFDLADRIFVELDEPVHIADTRSMSSITLFHLGRLSEATHRLEAGRRMWAEMNGGRAEPHTSDVYIARYWREAGRLGAALALLIETVERAARIADASLHGWAAAELAGLYVLLGQPARAKALLAPARAAPKPFVRFDGLVAEARLARALGESPQRVLEEARALAPSCMRAERLTWLLDMEHARTMPAAEAATLMRANFEAASAKRTWSAAAPSQALWIDALTRMGEVEAAVAQARLLHGWLRTADEATSAPEPPPPMGLYAPEYWLIVQRAFAAAGDDAAARDVARRGLGWVERVALPSLPAEFHASFLQRNPVNQALRRLTLR